MDVLGFKIDIKVIDNLAKMMAKNTLFHHDEDIDTFLAALDAFHTAVTLYQQELADIGDGTIVFSKKYLGRSD